MPKQEILPPVRVTSVAAPTVRSEPDNVRSTARELTVTTGDPVSSALTRWRSERHARTIGSLTTWTNAEASYFEALNKAVQSYSKLRRSTLELAEIPESYAHEKAVRRVIRNNELRQAQHHYEVGEYMRLTEVAHCETALIDARQQLAAQRKYGDSTNELAWKKKHVEMLELELDAAERRALLRQHRVELENPSRENLEDRLYRERAEAAADGRDAIIEEEVDAMFKEAENREK